MFFKRVSYRSVTITVEMFDGCFVYDQFYKPNGTGPEKFLGSDKAGWLVRKFLQSMKTDKWQKVGSSVHDIMYKIGGMEEDRNTADSIMRKIANAEVKADKNLNFFTRQVIYGRMWLNWVFVKRGGKSSFFYTYQKPNLKTVKQAEFDEFYDNLVKIGAIK